MLSHPTLCQGPWVTISTSILGLQGAASLSCEASRSWPGVGLRGARPSPPSLPTHHPEQFLDQSSIPTSREETSTVLVSSFFRSYIKNSLPNRLYSQFPVSPESHPSLHPHCLVQASPPLSLLPSLPVPLLPCPLYQPRARPWCSTVPL